METYYYRNFIACICNIFLFFFFSSWCLLLFHMWKSQSFKSFSHCMESGSCSTLRAVNIASFVNRLKFVLYVLMHVFDMNYWEFNQHLEAGGFHVLSNLKCLSGIIYSNVLLSQKTPVRFFYCTSKLSFFSLYWSDCIFSLSPSSSSINSPSEHFILHCIPSIKLILTSFKWIHLRFKIYLWRRNLIYFLEIYTF